MNTTKYPLKLVGPESTHETTIAIPEGVIDADIGAFAKALNNAWYRLSRDNEMLDWLPENADMSADGLRRMLVLAVNNVIDAERQAAETQNLLNQAIYKAKLANNLPDFKWLGTNDLEREINMQGMFPDEHREMRRAKLWRTIAHDRLDAVKLLVEHLTK